MSREAAGGSGQHNERWGYPGTYDSTEQAVKKAVALKASSVEEVVVVDVGGVGRRKKKANAEEEEAEEDDEIERRGELTFSCAGKVRQSLTDRLT
ncbi:hypothetical protein ALC57_09918 [Trachymyrmex cornetzi]|uniref:Uncharacterized protein n=1 Tax=Trachymyrmex cornetzi TaxID=471704 RepID=A0A151J4X4_9HYME|nr:hypothetical protein ALC57_09918 [Trachymyrmex cornetzi]